MKTYLSLILILSSSSALADGDRSAENHIRNFIRDFSSKKINGVARNYFYRSPHFVFGPHILTPQNSAEVESVLSDIRSSLEEEGYVKSKIERVETQFSGANMAVTSVLLKRYRGEGAVLDWKCSTYTMVDTDKGWKILAWLPSDPAGKRFCFQN